MDFILYYIKVAKSIERWPQNKRGKTSAATITRKILFRLCFFVKQQTFAYFCVFLFLYMIKL